MRCIAQGLAGSLGVLGGSQGRALAQFFWFHVFQNEETRNHGFRK
jgi:hypothetical protein